jgi:hypothetical protein
MTTHKARQGCIFKDVPMAVLVSQDSGPDRIYLAAALQDSHRALIVGQPTRMSAYVRSHVDLENGDRLVLATGVLKRANGTLLLRRSSKEQGIFINKFVNNRMKKPFKTSEINFVQPDHITSRTEGQLGALFPSANHTDRVHRGSQSIITKSIEILRNSAAQANKSLHQEATSG